MKSGRKFGNRVNVGEDLHMAKYAITSRGVEDPLTHDTAHLRKTHIDDQRAS